MGRTATRFRGDHLSALQNPVDTWEVEDKKKKGEGWARGTIQREKLQGHYGQPANRFTRIIKTGGLGPREVRLLQRLGSKLVGPSTMYRAGSPKYLSTPTLRKIISISFVVARPNYANAKRSLGMDLGR